MVRIGVRARSGAARFSVAVQAESIERALEIAKKQNLVRHVEVTGPMNFEVFFATEPAARSGSRPNHGDRRRNRAVEFSIHPGVS